MNSEKRPDKPSRRVRVEINTSMNVNIASSSVTTFRYSTLHSKRHNRKIKTSRTVYGAHWLEKLKLSEIELRVGIKDLKIMLRDTIC